MDISIYNEDIILEVIEEKELSNKDNTTGRE